VWDFGEAVALGDSESIGGNDFEEVDVAGSVNVHISGALHGQHARLVCILQSCSCMGGCLVLGLHNTVNNVARIVHTMRVSHPTVMYSAPL
jgi:hypothetical protein